VFLKGTFALGWLVHHEAVRILVYEDNLMWSVRLEKTLRALNHQPVTFARPEPQPADAAIVNLGAASLEPEILVPRLRQLGVHVIGHAGHREKELHELGRVIGCDTLATNRELTYSLERLLVVVNSGDRGTNSEELAENEVKSPPQGGA
jgi:hypothetical protein